MAWLSRASVDSLYLSGVALPMVLIGLGQGLTLGPLTVAGVAGVDAQDAGAASGAVNVAHQLGGSLGLSVLIVVFAAAGTHVLDGRALLAQRISSALGAGTAMLVLSLLAVLTLILPSVRAVVRENFLITDQAKGKQ
jgi:hypothetical protein